MWDKSAPDQTSIGWSVEVEREIRGRGEQSEFGTRSEGGAQDVPLSRVTGSVVAGEMIVGGVELDCFKGDGPGC